LSTGELANVEDDKSVWRYERRVRRFFSRDKRAADELAEGEARGDVDPSNDMPVSVVLIRDRDLGSTWSD
jgi:hypothetical protein